MTRPPLTALALNCTLKRSGEPSSTKKLLQELAIALSGSDVSTEHLDVAGLNILPGVTSNEGHDDAWPSVRAKIVATDILIIGTPIWLGQPSSVAKCVLERLDAFLDETDDQGRMPSFGKVAAVAVVGNEDGAHHCHAEIFQALNDVGFTIPATAGTYWVGEAMSAVDYKDLKKPHKQTSKATEMVARNTAHLARFLKENPYPGN